MMKIAMLGPTYPYRGGIAHYTTLLCEALRQDHDVKFISFKRQYPGILFPGKSDRDPSKEPVKADNVDYILDSLNPFTWIRVFQTIKKFNPDKVIIPWWVAFWTPQFWTIASLVKRYLKSEIVFICHNAIEHESNTIKKVATRLVLKKADRLISHSNEETLRIRSILGNGINAITAFHPTYTGLSARRYTKEQAKQKLELKGSILLFFGFVREYKGLDVFLDAMPIILKEKNVTLMVVGEFWNDKQNYLDKINHYRISKNIRIIDEYVPNEDIGIYFAASDLVVQPYNSASGSGICQMAYGFDRPVIATNVGSLPEVVLDGGNGRLVEPRNPMALAEAILESLEPGTLTKFSENAMKTKEKFSWERMADIVVDSNM